MKKIFFLGVIILSITISGCKKDFGITPEAPVEHDKSNKGVYKGVLTGSTGHFKFIINDDNSSTITLTFEGKTITMTGKAIPIGGGKNKYLFNKSGYNFEVIISSDGKIHASKFSAPGGKTARVTVVKEKSNAIVQCFEGSYKGDSSGIWNMVIRGSAITGSSYDNGSKRTRGFNGKLSGNKINLKGHGKDGGGGTGQLSGEVVSGAWRGGNQSGTWTGKRTL